MSEAAPLVVVEDLVKEFPATRGLWGWGRPRGVVRAVDHVSFRIASGQTLGLVGESGCGKSTVARTILRLLEPDGGRVVVDGADVFALRPAELRALRRRMQIVFQDPYGSLNPRMTVRQTLVEPLVIHGLASGSARLSRVAGLLEEVGLDRQLADSYPHELSGGQRQRVGIARALAMQPSFIVCDEPVSALDVSIQAQIINLLEDLQRKYGLTFLFIAHDLAVVRHISDRVIVMYLGKVMEIADRDTLYADPQHPYTKALLDAVPIPDPQIEARREHRVLGGEVPSPLNPPSGCVFHTRCPLASEECKMTVPALREVRPRHFAACIKL